MDNLDYHDDKSAMFKYAISKVGNYFQATEFGKRYEADGVVSVSLNPGMLNSDLYRHQSAVFGFFLRRVVLHPSIFGAYTELFAGLSPEVTIERSGDWGESHSTRKNIHELNRKLIIIQLFPGEDLWKFGRIYSMHLRL
jgi:hypothetical protein